MKSQTFFQKLVKEHRKLLIDKGFLPSTLTMYAQGKCFPSEKAAKRIAKITGTDIKNFPILRKIRQ